MKSKDKLVREFMVKYNMKEDAAKELAEKELSEYMFELHRNIKMTSPWARNK